ncbi:MAG: spermidine synthase [Candidatus Delongbacteria bacterium]|nr:spermidine synthase [Candidatus Delongbacteria bacterium]MBN2836843.1 spermidine synthase [Candidatus Delongbacteria bacterium]
MQKNSYLIVLFIINLLFLVFEVAGNHYLALQLGSTVNAASIVLMIFMLSIGLGAYFNGKVKQLQSSYLLPILLIIIGVSGAALSIFTTMQINYILKTVLSILSIIGIALPMGGILPLIVDLTVNESKRIGNDIGNIYAVETIAGVVGSILTGFYLLGHVGIFKTLIISSFLSIIFGVLCLFLKKTNSHENLNQAKSYEKSDISLLIFTGISGFLLFSTQILWIRAYKVYLTNTSYTFTLISAVTIFGMFVGSYFSTKMKNSSKSRLSNLMTIELILLIIGLLVLIKSPEFLLVPLHNSLENPVYRIGLPPIILTLVTLFPIAFISGITFPGVLSLFIENSENKKMKTGLAVFINSIGIVLGLALSAFLFIPLLGVYKSALIIVLFCSVFLFFFNKDINKKQVFITLVTIIPVLLFWFDIQILPPSFSMVDREVLYYNETKDGTITVGKEDNGRLISFVNNSQVMGVSYDAVKTVKMLGYIPYLLGGNLEKACIVGFGIGGTTSTIASIPTNKNITCIELVADVKNAGKYYERYNNGVYKSEKLNIHAGDGRQFIYTTDEKFDIISSDPTHPVLGSGPLYTKEYFEMCKSKLTENGYGTQYLPLHKLSESDFNSILVTFATVFENSSIWLGQSHIVLLGSNSKQNPDYIDFYNRSQNIKDPLFYSDPMHLSSLYICSGNDILNELKQYPIISDDRNILEYFNPEAFLFENWEKNIITIKKLSKDPGSYFKNLNDRNRLRNYLNSRSILIDGMIEKNRGNKKNYIDKLIQASRINPDDQEIPFLIKAENQTNN